MSDTNKINEILEMNYNKEKERKLRMEANKLFISYWAHSGDGIKVKLKSEKAFENDRRYHKNHLKEIKKLCIGDSTEFKQFDHNRKPHEKQKEIFVMRVK